MKTHISSRQRFLSLLVSSECLRYAILELTIVSPPNAVRTCVQFSYKWSQHQFFLNISKSLLLTRCPCSHHSKRDVQDCQQRLTSAFDLPLIFLCSLIQTLTLTPPPNNALLAILDMYGERPATEFMRKVHSHYRKSHYLDYT